jgi:hypothetical protein
VYLTSLDRSDKDDRAFATMLTVLHGRASQLRRRR